MSEKATSNALEQLLVTANSLNDFESAKDLIKKVVDSSLIYSFSEFLEIPIISKVRKTKPCLDKKMNSI